MKITNAPATANHIAGIKETQQQGKGYQSGLHGIYRPALLLQIQNYRYGTYYIYHCKQHYECTEKLLKIKSSEKGSRSRLNK